MAYYQKQLVFKRSTLAFVVMAVVYVAVFTTLSFARMDTLKTYMNDLGNMDQAVWSSLHGVLLHQSNTIVGQPLTRFYAHFDPILLAFVPLYKLKATPVWFFFFQSLAIALSAVPIFGLARKYLSKSAALLLSLAYFFFPLVQNANLYDFHPCVLALPVIAFMIWAVWENHVLEFWLLAVLLVTIKEEMSLLLVAAGAMMIWRKRAEHGVVAIVAGTSVFILVMKVIIPLFSPFSQHMFFASQSAIYGSGFSSRYGWLGASLGEVLQTLLFHPVHVAQHLLTPDRIKYVSFMLASLLFLPVFSPIMLIALPTLLINLSDSTNMMFSFYFYHSAVLAPILFLALIDVLVRIKRYNDKVLPGLLAAVLVMTAIFHMSEGVLPYSFNPMRYAWSDFKREPHDKLVGVVQQLVGPEASVSVQQNLGAFFSQRFNVYRFPMQAGETDYVLVDFYNPYHGPMADALYDYQLLYPRAEILQTLYRLVDAHAYGVVWTYDGLVLLKKGVLVPDSRQLIDQAVNLKGFLRAQ